MVLFFGVLLFVFILVALCYQWQKILVIIVYVIVIVRSRITVVGFNIVVVVIGIISCVLNIVVFILLLLKFITIINAPMIITNISVIAISHFFYGLCIDDTFINEIDLLLQSHPLTLHLCYLLFFPSVYLIVIY